MEAERGDQVPGGGSDQGWTPWQRNLTEPGAGPGRGLEGKDGLSMQG